jgi:hypothetical protein
VCIAAINAENSITAEPAVVEPLPGDFPDSRGRSPLGADALSPESSRLSVQDMRAEFRKGHSNQFGALNRRPLYSVRNVLTLESDDPQEREQHHSRMLPTRLFSRADCRDFDVPANSGDGPKALTPTKSPAVRLSIVGSVHGIQTEDGEISYVIIKGQHDEDDDSEEDGGKFSA